MDRDSYVIASATGVDVNLVIAGPGSRSYAFLLDWHIRVLVALAWFMCAALLTSGTVRLGLTAPHRSAVFYAAAILPPLLIYFLYHPVLEVVMRGRTPGKRMAGVRIVTRSGGTPGVGALLLRNFFRLIDQVPVFYILGLASTLITAQRLRIGDLAAGTLLIYDRAQAGKAFAQLSMLAQHSQLDPAVIDLANELLLRWTELADEPRMQFARTLLRRIAPSEGVAAQMSSAQLHERLQALLRGQVLQR